MKSESERRFASFFVRFSSLHIFCSRSILLPYLFLYFNILFASTTCFTFESYAMKMRNVRQKKLKKIYKIVQQLREGECKKYTE